MTTDLQPQYETVLFASTDDLISRRMHLERQTEIPDMQAYAQAWTDLAADFEVCGLLNNAEYCKARAKHYAGMSGAYVRTFEPPFAELVAFGDMSEAERQFIVTWIV